MKFSSAVLLAASASSVMSAALYSNATVTDIATTVVTITSCSDNKCTEVPKTTGLTTVTEESTIYTTYCPLSSEETPAPAPTSAAPESKAPAPAPTFEATTIAPESKAPAPTSAAPSSKAPAPAPSSKAPAPAPSSVAAVSSFNAAGSVGVSAAVGIMGALAFFY